MLSTVGTLLQRALRCSCARAGLRYILWLHCLVPLDRGTRCSHHGGDHACTCLVRKQSGCVSFYSALKDMKRALQTASSKQFGLFGHPNLRSPTDWVTVTAQAQQGCDSLVQKTRTTPPGRAALHLLDEISDVLCHATDAAAFCAATHADTAWRAAAQKSHQQLQRYMAELNTSSVLWDSLRRSMELAHTSSSSSLQAQEAWTQEEIKVGDSLIHEFQQAGMALNENAQAQYRKLAMEQQGLCAELMSFETHRDSRRSAVLGVPKSLSERFKLPRAAPFTPAEFSVPAAQQPVHIHTDTSVQRWMLGQPYSSSAREVAYCALNSLPRDIQNTVLKLAHVRKTMAELVGLPSYMHYQLASAGITQQPEAVEAFLGTVRSMHHSRCEQELEEVTKFAHESGLMKGAKLGSWDYGVCRVHALESCLQQTGLPEKELQFTAGGIMNTLFNVVEDLFGVQFVAESADSSELWAPSVRKYSAVSVDRGFLGTVFLDLYQRPGKYTTDAHFTLRCGRRLSKDEYRRPIVALSCSFLNPDATLSFSEVKTLFHELGHALNSVLCDNDLQHLFGARGALDVVELPSHVLERAVLHPTVLRQLVSTSLQGRDTLSPERLQKVESALILRERFCESLAQMHSLMMPMADALLHGKTPPATPEGLSKDYFDNVVSVLPMDVPRGTFPRLSLNHIVTYGGLCHAYTFADEISRTIWEGHLKNGPRDGGQLAELLYRPGGAVDALEALRKVVPNDATGSTQQLLRA